MKPLRPQRRPFRTPERIDLMVSEARAIALACSRPLTIEAARARAVNARAQMKGLGR